MLCGVKRPYLNPVSYLRLVYLFLSSLPYTLTHTHTHTHTHMVLTHVLAHFQVDTVGTSLDLSHVFFLDAGNEIFIWCGSKSSLMSRSKARLIAEKMNKYERKNRARIVQFRSVRAVYCGVCRIKVIIVNVSFFLGYWSGWVLGDTWRATWDSHSSTLVHVHWVNGSNWQLKLSVASISHIYICTHIIIALADIHYFSSIFMYLKFVLKYISYVNLMPLPDLCLHCSWSLKMSPLTSLSSTRQVLVQGTLSCHRWRSHRVDWYAPCSGPTRSTSLTSTQTSLSGESILNLKVLESETCLYMYVWCIHVFELGWYIICCR